MPRAAPLQPSLNAGELGPRMVARTDFAKYPLGCATLENMIPLPQGGATRRPGTVFVAESADHETKRGAARSGSTRTGGASTSRIPTPFSPMAISR